MLLRAAASFQSNPKWVRSARRRPSLLWRGEGRTGSDRSDGSEDGSEAGPAWAAGARPRAPTFRTGRVGWGASALVLATGQGADAPPLAPDSALGTHSQFPPARGLRAMPWIVAS